MQQYQKLLQYILDNGSVKQTEQAPAPPAISGTRCVLIYRKASAGHHQEGTYEEHYLRVALVLKGETNIKYLTDHNVSIWNEWADENGELGPVYGKQWRSWEGKDGQVIDQLSDAIKQIKTILTAAALSSAHGTWQSYQRWP